MKNPTELEKVKIAATKYKYWYPKRLIEAALAKSIFMNLNRNKSYSYSRVYAMLREGRGWVTKKLVDFAEKNPIE